MRHRALLAAGGGGPWSLLSLGSMLKVWLDADDAATFTYSSGVEISQWADKSGNTNHATQAAGGAQPSRATNQINGKAAVKFAGNEFFTLPSFGGSFTAAEVFVVVKGDLDDGTRIGLWHLSSDTAITFFPWSDSSVYDSFGTSARKSTGNPTPSLTSWNLYNVRSASGAWSSHFNGTQHYTTATNTVGMGGYLLGTSASSWSFLGHIAEFIIVDSVLSSGDRANVHTYLADKYALTIA